MANSPAAPLAPAAPVAIEAPVATEAAGRAASEWRKPKEALHKQAPPRCAPSSQTRNGLPASVRLAVGHCDNVVPHVALVTPLELAHAFQHPALGALEGGLAMRRERRVRVRECTGHQPCYCGDPEQAERDQRDRGDNHERIKQSAGFWPTFTTEFHCCSFPAARSVSI